MSVVNLKGDVRFVIGYILCPISLEILTNYSPCCRAEIS